MTTQEAIDVLFNEWKCIDRNDGIHCDRKLAISALEKQIPKKPIRDGVWAPILCPTCGAWLSIHHGDGYFTCNEPEYCYNDECHQLLDWEEDHDESGSD